jgi:hypothetical protein
VLLWRHLIFMFWIWNITVEQSTVFHCLSSLR